MGRHSGNTPSTPQARSRTIARERRRRHAGRSTAIGSLRFAASDRLSAALANAGVQARRAGIPTAAIRPAGVVASSALVLSAALGGGIVLSQQAQPAHAAELFVAEQSADEGPATSFAVTVDGETTEVTTTASTLSSALRDGGIQVNSEDIVSVPLSGPVTPAEVEITRVDSHLTTDQIVDEHGSREVEDANLPKGERRVTTAGVNGTVNVVSRVTTHNGEGVEKVEEARVVVSERRDEVVAVGTKEPTPAPAPAAPQRATQNAAPAVSATGSRGIAADMVAARGWGSDQFRCLDDLWQKESNWNHTAQNPSSGAYGIPQSLPGNKMASAGADWQTNPATQIRWGLDYIAGRYGTPCAAWGHSQANNWY